METENESLVSESAEKYIDILRKDSEFQFPIEINDRTCPHGDVDVRAITSALAEVPWVTRMEVKVSGLPNSSCNIIAEYLAGTHSVKDMVIDSERRPKDLSFLLNGPLRVESIDLCDCSMRECANSFSNFIQSTTFLKKLQLSDPDADISAEQAETLQNACLANESLQELVFSGEMLHRLSSCLIQHCGHVLKKLELHYTRCDDFSPVCSLLRKSQSLEELALDDTGLSLPECVNLVEALSANHSLLCLSIQAGSISSMARDLVGDMIRAASSLQRVHIDNSAINPTAWDNVIHCLEENTSVRELGICLEVSEGFPTTLFCPLLSRVSHLERLAVDCPDRKAIKDLALAMQANHSLVALKVEFSRYPEPYQSLEILTEGLLRNNALKSLQVLWDMEYVQDAVIHQLRRNVTMTEISFTRPITSLILGSNRPIPAHDKIDAIVARNQELQRLGYGMLADSKLWAEIIQLVLRNEHIGPSMVFGLLTHRPDELDNDGD